MNGRFSQWHNDLLSHVSGKRTSKELPVDRPNHPGEGRVYEHTFTPNPEEFPRWMDAEEAGSIRDLDLFGAQQFGPKLPDTITCESMTYRLMYCESIHQGFVLPDVKIWLCGAEPLDGKPYLIARGWGHTPYLAYMHMRDALEAQAKPSAIVQFDSGEGMR